MPVRSLTADLSALQGGAERSSETDAQAESSLPRPAACREDPGGARPAGGAAARSAPISRSPEITVDDSWRATAIRASRRRPRPTASGGRRSMIRRSIAGRARLPAEPAAADCRAADRRGPRPVGIATGQQYPQMQAAIRQRDRDGAQPERAPTSPASTATTSDYQVGLRRGLGAGLLGQVPARRRGGGRQRCSRRWPTTTPRSSRSPRRSRGPTSRSAPSRC